MIHGGTITGKIISDEEQVKLISMRDELIKRILLKSMEGRNVQREYFTIPFESEHVRELLKNPWSCKGR